MGKGKVLITGGAGFIGSNLAVKLVDEGYTVSVLDNLSEQIHGKNPDLESPLLNSIKGKVDLFIGCVTNRKLLAKAIDGCEIVVHFAAETGTGQSMYEIERYSNINILGTAVLLDLLANDKSGADVKKVVVASSRSIYGEGRYECKVHGDVYPNERLECDMLNGIFENRCPECNENVFLRSTPEFSKLHPSSVYGITKYTQEQLVLTVCKSLNISALALRYQNVYGPGQSLKNPYTGILSIFSNLLRSNSDINIFEDGLESRDFVFIDDVVEATILAIALPGEQQVAINIGSGIPTTVLKVANRLKTAYGSSSKIKISGNFRLGDIRNNYADLTKAKKTLGFEPRINFEDGIEYFSKWVLSQKVEENGYIKSLEKMKQKNMFK